MGGFRNMGYTGGLEGHGVHRGGGGGVEGQGVHKGVEEQGVHREVG